MKINKTELLDALRDPEKIKSLRNASGTMVEGKATTPDEISLSDWLGRLKLLHGVPFHYLVPNVDMLPMESIRFFYCNTTWLDHLQEGALSIGRSTSTFLAHDQSVAGDLNALGWTGASRQRRKVYGHLVNHVHDHLLTQLEGNTAVSSGENATGFLLRSGVVSGWKGLQVDAFSDVQQKIPCRMLRMDHLSPNVLMCLFEGTIRSIRIHEQPEVLHFGADVSPDPPHDLEKSFRYVVDVPENPASGKPDHAAGTQTDITPLQMKTYVRYSSHRVVCIDTLARKMAETLKDQIKYAGPFTSAEFALEMLEGVEAVNFTIQ